MVIWQKTLSGRAMASRGFELRRGHRESRYGLAAQVAAPLQIAQDAVVDKRLEKVDEALQELLSTAMWKKRLRSEFSVRLPKELLS